jgi:hypothetical protein
MIIVVTGTIAPGRDAKYLTIRDSQERLDQYLSALQKLIHARPDAKIVFCENSGFGTEAFDELKELSDKNDMRFEALSFQGDSAAVASHGKGFGEGEIVRYVLDNSELAKGEDYMIKITGRLVVDNIANIVRKVKRNQIYFNIPNIHRRDIFDTRLYAMPIEAFRKYFIDEYQNVNDDGGYYLELVYKDVIHRNGLSTRNFPCYPRIVGRSGSGGITYEYTEWKSKIRDFLSLFNIYGRAK